MLSTSQLAVIKQTVPVLQENGELLTRHFYQRLFRENPEVQAFFNPAHQSAGTQQRALAGAICAYAQNIENLSVLTGAVDLITQKHASLGIQAEHYPIIGENLLASIQEVLGEAATPEIIDAWAAAYGVLADIFINRETQIYDAHKASFGWSGFKRFVVKKRETASDNIVSLYMAAEDGKPLPAHQPGQYITVRVTPVGSEPVMRNYSLSNRPGTEDYRISVKREQASVDGVPDGVVSNFLHDQIQEGDVVELAPPCGEFTLRTGKDEQRPLVLIAGGVGITPLLSMLHAALEEQQHREVIFIQCALNSVVRPFAEELAVLRRDYPNLNVHVRLSEPAEADRQRGDYDSEGFLDAALLDQVLGERSGEYYLCGPTPMLKHAWNLLKRREVGEADINLEFFGPASDLAA